MSRRRTFAVIAGGGTGGHVVPAIAVAQALVARGHERDSIRMVGSARGLEASIVPPTGFPLTLLPGRGIQRKLSVQNVGAVAGLLFAMVRAFALVARERPRVVLSVGGYAAAPAALAAVALRVPLVVADSNALPGAVHRLLGRFARAAAVAFPDTPLPRAVVTGTPVRSEVLEVAAALADDAPAARRGARAALGLPPDALVVWASGGSLGSRRINEAVLALAERWAASGARAGVAIHHAIGRRDWPELADRAASLERETAAGRGVRYAGVAYEERAHLALAAADVAVARAGGSTVAELAVAGLPAILVPLPIAAEDHQTATARAVVAAGAGVHVPDRELDADRLEAELAALLDDDAGRAAMAAAARRLGRPDAAASVAALLEEHARA